MPRYVELDVALQEIQPRIWRLLAGDRACPPEDCGGVSGYERMAHFVQTGEDILEDDPERLRTWLGSWRPDAFDLAAAKEKFDR